MKVGNIHCMSVVRWLGRYLAIDADHSALTASAGVLRIPRKTLGKKNVRYRIPTSIIHPMVDAARKTMFFSEITGKNTPAFGFSR